MDKYIPCRWMTSFVYLRNLATSDIPISGFPGWSWRRKQCCCELVSLFWVSGTTNYRKDRIFLPWSHFLYSFCWVIYSSTLRKHAYPNILKISPPKTGSFQTKNTDIFHISAQNAKAVRTSTHNLCFWAEILKVMYTSVNPSFTI